MLIATMALAVYILICLAISFWSAPVVDWQWLEGK